MAARDGRVGELGDRAGRGIEHLEVMAFSLLECARTASDVASRRTVHALTDEHLAVGEQHCLGRGERLQDAAYLLPSRPRIDEVDTFDRPRLSTALVVP